MGEHEEPETAPWNGARSARSRVRVHSDARVRTVRHELSWRSCFMVVAIVVGLWAVVRVWQSILIFIVALILAATFSPVVAYLERRGIRRSLALTLILLGLLLAVFGLGALMIPAFASQFGTIKQTAPQMQNRLADFVAGIGPLSGQAARIRQANPARYLDPINAYLLAHAAEAAQTVVLGFTTVVLAFYLIADHERVQGFFFALLPRRFHVRTARMLLDMETVVGGYMRGQAITSLSIGGFTFILLLVMRIPNALALAILAGLADLIPYVGPVLAIAPSVLFALIKGPGTAVIVLIALVVYHQLESHILIPRVYGQSLRLSPVAVLVALLFGGQLLGIVGALLALPLAAGIRVLVKNYRFDLPGTMPGEVEERETLAEAEAVYDARTHGASAVEAATVATALAEHLEEETGDETDIAEAPIGEQEERPHPSPSYTHPTH